MPSSSSVQVVVRLRPMNDKEKKEGTLPVISASTTKKSVTVIKGVGAKQARSQFSFDNVFTSFSNQQDVFSATLQPVITDVLQGFETCVFAYGQTGTGKTHTMEGNLQDPDHYGIIPRSAQALFDALDSPQYVQTNVTCSYLEIYNEELSDLLVASSGPPSSAIKHNHLSSTTTKLDIVHGSKKQGVHCRGLSQQAVHSADDVLQLMQRAFQARRVGETGMNKQSSRSHCIFTMRVEAKRTLPDGSSVLESQGRLHLVDLAGSESAKTAELKESSAAHQATREQERRNINKSLLTLGRVISMLKEQAGKKSKTMIPYRDSKLTRILQEALGGRCKTVIIATISPSILNVQESLQTLHYAQTANGIKNKPAVSNSYMSAGSAAGAIDMSSLSSGDKTVPVERWQEMEIRMEHMQQEVEEARQALARNYLQHQGLEERVDKAEKAKDEMQFALDKASTQLETLSNNLEHERTAKEMVTAQLRETKITLTKTATVLKATQQTEQSLTLEALSLLQSLKDSIGNGDKLYNMVQTSHDEEVSRRGATRGYHESMSVALNNAVSRLEEIATSEKEIVQVGELMSTDHAQRKEAIEEAKAVISKIASVVAVTVSTVNQGISNGMIPTLDSLATGINSNVETTRKVVVEGEVILSASCTSALAQLESFGVQLGKMDINFNRLQETSLSNVEKAILETNSNVSIMVESATTSIQAVRDRSVETRADLVELIEEWTTAGATATSHVKGISYGQQLALETAFTLLESEMHNHQSVDQELAFVQDFISKGQASQRSILDSQNKRIRNQKEELDDAVKSHEDLCGQVMETVMGGVKDLVAQQLKLIATSHTERTGKLVRNNEDILGLHTQLSDKSSAIFTTLSSTNTKIQSHNKAMHKTDSSILKTINEGSCALAEVEQAVVDFEASNTRFDERARAEIVILESVDENIGDIQESFATNGKSCVEQIETSTQKTISESISSVGQAGSRALTFARKDIIQSMSTAIAKVEKPRESLIQHVSQNLQSIEDTTQIGLVDVVALAKENIIAIKAASESVNKSSDDFCSSRCAMHQSQCDESRKLITTMLETHETTIQDLASACKENVINSKDSSSRFGHDVIKMDVDIEDVPRKFTLEYSNALSSTPDGNELFIGMDFESIDVSMGSSVGSPSTKEQVTVTDVVSPGPDVLRETSFNSQAGPRDKSDTSKNATRKRTVDVNSRLNKRSKQKS